MLKFLTGDLIADAVSKNIAKSGPTDLAVSYWGKGAAARLGLTKNNRKVRVLCDAFSLACNPIELDRLLGCGFEIKTITGFHAKVYLTKKRAVVGSANASINGLGQEGDADPGLEAAVETDDVDEIEKARRWFQDNWDCADDVDEDVIKRIRLLWKLRTKASLFATLAENAALFGGQPIYFGVFEDDPKASHGYEAAWKRVKHLYDPNELTKAAYRNALPIYLDTNLGLRKGDHVVNYWVKLGADRRVKSLSANGGVWRVKGTLPIDPERPKSGNIVYAVAVTHIAGLQARREYGQIGELFRAQYVKKAAFKDAALRFDSLEEKHRDIFDRLRAWRKAESKGRAAVRALRP